MKVGITGTRDGMTPEQHIAFAELIAHGCIEEFHHGDCVGVDETAADLFSKVWGTNFVHSHPPTNERFRAFAKSGTIYEALPYLRRNRKIVEAADILIVVPKTNTWPEGYGGTWHCYRQARELGKKRIIIWPDGTLQSEA
jgi:hypothetical protein